MEDEMNYGTKNGGKTILKTTAMRYQEATMRLMQNPKNPMNAPGPFIFNPPLPDSENKSGFLIEYSDGTFEFVSEEFFDTTATLVNPNNEAFGGITTMKQIVPLDPRDFGDNNHLQMGRVFPSDEGTIFVEPDDIYGGAHVYHATHSLGFDPQTQKPIYTSCESKIQFVQKNDDGTMVAGLQSEQLLQILIDRHTKLNNRFPSEQNLEFIKCLERCLELQAQRVIDRMNRGVMGELKN